VNAVTEIIGITQQTKNNYTELHKHCYCEWQSLYRCKLAA